MDQENEIVDIETVEEGYDYRKNIGPSQPIEPRNHSSLLNSDFVKFRGKTYPKYFQEALKHFFKLCDSNSYIKVGEDILNLLQNPIDMSQIEYNGNTAGGMNGCIRFGTFKGKKVAVKTALEESADLSREIATHLFVQDSLKNCSIQVPPILGLSKNAIVMKAIKGKTLESYIDDTDGPLSPKILNIMAEFFYFMSYFRLQHHDLHSKNILVVKKNDVLSNLCVIDFGYCSCCKTFFCQNHANDYTMWCDHITNKIFSMSEEMKKIFKIAKKFKEECDEEERLRKEYESEAQAKNVNEKMVKYFVEDSLRKHFKSRIDPDMIGWERNKQFWHDILKVFQVDWELDSFMSARTGREAKRFSMDRLEIIL